MLVRCIVESVRINLANNSRVVILKDSKIERYLLIWIGETESYAIASELQGAHYERPLTHDLLYTIVGRLGADIHLERSIRGSGSAALRSRIRSTSGGRRLRTADGFAAACPPELLHRLPGVEGEL